MPSPSWPPKAVKCAQSAPHAKAVTVAANVASEVVKADVNVASVQSAAQAKPPMPARLKRAWVQTRPATTPPQPKAPAPPKTVSAANAARVTATAATAANAQVKHVRTQQARQPQLKTPPSPAA